jgi:CHAT domain-containing protein/tetratricopeptide (TPR) repeat protein
MTTKAPGSKKLIPHLTGSVWRKAIVLLLPAVVVLIPIVYKLTHRSPLQRAMSALVTGYSKRRLIEPRLSGGFRAGQYKPGTEDDLIDKESISYASALIGQVTNEDDSPEARLIEGRLYLCEGKTADASAPITRAMKELPNSAEVHNDFGSYLYQIGKYEDALAHYENALRLSPGMPAALFNQSLCYQRLLLLDSARDVMKSLATTERDSGWLEESRRRTQDFAGASNGAITEKSIIAELNDAIESGNDESVRTIASGNFKLMRKLGLVDLLTQYLQSAAQGNQEEADRSLARMRAIGKAVSESLGDSAISDAARYVEGLRESERKTELDLVKDCWAATLVLLSQKPAAALPIFERLRRDFAARSNSLFEHICTFHLAVGYYFSTRYGDSIKLLSEALPAAENHSWRYYRAKTLCQLGIDYTLIGRDSLGINYCRQAIDLCKDIDEVRAKALQYLSVSYWRLGDLDTALSSQRETTRLSLQLGSEPRDLANNYLQMADIERLRGNHVLALKYAAEAINFSEGADDYDRAAQSCSFQAIEQATLGHPDRAEESMGRAFGFLDKEDASKRSFTEPLVYIRAGQIAAARKDPAEAIESYTRAERQAASVGGDVTMRIMALSGRARAYEEDGHFENAQSDLQQAAQLVETYRSHIAESENRSHYLEASQGVFDRLISIEVNPQVDLIRDAFATSERSRARAFLDEIMVRRSETSNGSRGSDVLGRNDLDKFGSVDPANLSDVRAVLPEDTALLEYAVTDGGTSIFVVTNSSIEIGRSDASTSDLDALVSEYISQLRERAPTDELSQNAKRLYDDLVRPVETWIRNKKNLCIIPDKALNLLPFAPLIDGSSEYLIKSHSLTYAPSASVLLRCIEQEKLKGNEQVERVAVVGNPAFDRRAFPKLRDLPEAEGEARAIAALYDRDAERLMIGPEATKARLREAMQNCDVAHLAVHCLVDETSSWLAALVLAQSGLNTPRSGAEGGGPGENPDLLYLKDLYGFNLPRTRLVVLSACESALGQYYRGEGIVSLVRPFMAAKVPTVVASLWAVESAATGPLMVEMHRERTIGRFKTADALRAAQIQAARDSQRDHPYYWAGFIVIGTGS